MPSWSEDGDAGSKRDGVELTDADVPDEDRPKDPVLFLVDSFQRGCRKIDVCYARYEALPGRIKFALGAVGFLSSTYFGTVIRGVLDAFVITRFVSVLELFSRFALGIQLTLLLHLFLLFQSSLTNHRLKSIGNIVEGEDMDSDDVMPDGGLCVKRFETSEAGAVGGAGFGAVFGAMFGYPAIFGGMFFGAVVGNLIEEWSVRRRNKRKFKTKIVEYLLRERVFDPEAVETETVRHWFPKDEASVVTEAFDELIADHNSPIVQTSNGRIQLTVPSEAVAYLDRNGGRVPSAFAGPNRPPRPTEDGT